VRSASKTDIKKIVSIISENHKAAKIEPGSAELRILDYGLSKFHEEAGEREVDLSDFGLLKAALGIEGPLKKYATSREFLHFLNSANPSLTGWPIWLVSQSFMDQKTHPYPYQATWEQFIEAPGFSGYHLDFMMF
jgi:hypothetical protein